MTLESANRHGKMVQSFTFALSQASMIVLAPRPGDLQRLLDDDVLARFAATSGWLDGVPRWAW